MPRRHFLGAVGAAGISGPAFTLAAGADAARATPQSTPDQASATAAGHPSAPPYPTLSRPFAMPGVKDQDWTGALFVTDGEARFALRVGLLTAQGRLVRERMTNNLWRIGPSTPDGAYKEVRVSTDDRMVMPAHLEALREVIAHPGQWSPSAVADATDVNAAKNIKAAGLADFNDRGAQVRPGLVPEPRGEAVTHPNAACSTRSVEGISVL